MTTQLPYTGREFLDSLDDGREVWIYGERIANIAEHPAFRNTARMIARLYDALHRDHAEHNQQRPAHGNQRGNAKEPQAGTHANELGHEREEVS